MAQAVQPYSTFIERENLRPYAVRGDSMEPGLCRGDVALVSPIDDYDGEGVYLVGIDCPNLYRVSCDFKKDGGLCLSRDNKRYSDQSVTPEYFRENVVAKVSFRLQVFDRALLPDELR